MGNKVKILFVELNTKLLADVACYFKNDSDYLLEPVIHSGKFPDIEHYNEIIKNGFFD